MLSAARSEGSTRTPDGAVVGSARHERDVGARAPHRPAVCVALLGSALIHSTVMEEHLSQWLMAGFFFLALVGVETALALAVIYGWGRRTAQAVVVTGVVTVGVWLMSRTVGLPVGPADFRVAESVGVPDVASCLLELGAAALVWRTAVAAGPDTIGPSTGATRRGDRWVTIVLVMAALAVTGWGLRPVLAPRESHDAHVQRTHQHDATMTSWPLHRLDGTA